MSAGPNTLAKADAVLKEIYEPGLAKQLNNETPTLARIEKTGDGVQTGPLGGKYVKFAIEISGNHGHGARRENEALPRARTSTRTTGTRGLTYQYGAIEITGPTMRLADTNEQAFFSVLDDETESLKTSLKKDLNRQMYGTTAGILVTAASGTTTTIVAPNADVKYIQQDHYIDIWNDSLTAFDPAGPFTVTSVVRGASDTTVTFSPAASEAVAAGDSARIHNSSIDADEGKEITGFGDIVDDTTPLYGIDPSTYPVWASIVRGNSGTDRPVSEGLLLKMVDDVRETSGHIPTVAFWTSGIRRSYFNLLGQLRNFQNTTTFVGGYKAVKFEAGGNDIPLVDDMDAPANTIHMINEKKMKIYRDHDWQWMTLDGSRWKMVQRNGELYDAYTAVMSTYLNLGTRQRNAHAKFEDVSEA